MEQGYSYTQSPLDLHETFDACRAEWERKHDRMSARGQGKWVEGLRWSAAQASDLPADDGVDMDYGKEAGRATRDLRATCTAIRAAFATVLTTLLASASSAAKPCHLAEFRKATAALAGKLHGLLHVCLTAARLTTSTAVAPTGVTAL